MELSGLVEEIIIRRTANGCKGVDLATHVSSELITKYAHVYNDLKEDHELLFKVIEDLIERGEIIEIAYVVPDTDYREKSFYVPKGTDIRINGKIT